MFAAGSFALSLLLSSPAIVAQAGAGAQRPAPPRLVLKSSAFDDGARIPAKYAGMIWLRAMDGHVLGKTVFVGLYSRTSQSASQEQPIPFKPTADVKQLMHAVVIPSSNVVFRV